MFAFVVLLNFITILQTTATNVQSFVLHNLLIFYTFYRVGQKSDTPWYLSFLSCYRCTIFAIFLYSRITYIKRRRSLSADVNKFCFYANKL